jgi:hypothetical protein
MKKPDRLAATRHSWQLLALASLWSTVAACGCAPTTTGPDTFPTTGIVTLDGTPVAGADLSFYPSSGSSRIGGGYAVTNDDGSYEAAIFVEGGKSTKLGLPAGEYNVEVVKLEHVDGDASLSKPPHNILPVQYGSVKTSALKATVQPKSTNRNDYHLQK